MKRKQRPGFTLPIVVGVFLVALAVWLVSPSPDVEIIDSKWERSGDVMLVESKIRNNADRTLRITIEYVADLYVQSEFKRALTFVGSTRIDHDIPARSTSMVSTSLPLVLKVQGNIFVSPTILKVSEPPSSKHNGIDSDK